MNAPLRPSRCGASAAGTAIFTHRSRFSPSSWYWSPWSAFHLATVASIIALALARASGVPVMVTLRSTSPRNMFCAIWMLALLSTVTRLISPPPLPSSAPIDRMGTVSSSWSSPPMAIPPAAPAAPLAGQRRLRWPPSSSGTTTEPTRSSSILRAFSQAASSPRTVTSRSSVPLGISYTAATQMCAPVFFFSSSMPAPRLPITSPARWSGISHLCVFSSPSSSAWPSSPRRSWSITARMRRWASSMWSTGPERVTPRSAAPSGTVEGSCSRTLHSASRCSCRMVLPPLPMMVPIPSMGKSSVMSSRPGTSVGAFFGRSSGNSP
mmetsp:Transcript_5888/g.9498  ORF Transcript_5888/g.9498 Transcript_5888/m.9498 type:complete len:323 (-) Transcript_5888:113-1081(-)